MQTTVIRTLVPERVYWDLGAHLGWYVLVASEAGARQIFALEAAPITFQHLTKTAEGKRAPIVLLNAALVAAAGAADVDFYVGAGEDGLLYSSTNPVMGDFERVRVPAVDLDGLVTKHGWTEPHLIKMDLEGSEPWIVPQIVARFRETAPDIIVEVNFEACAAHGAFPFTFLEQLLSTRHATLVIDESRARLRRLDSPKHVRHGDNIVALSAESYQRLEHALPKETFE